MSNSINRLFLQGRTRLIEMLNRLRQVINCILLCFCVFCVFIFSLVAGMKCISCMLNGAISDIIFHCEQRCRLYKMISEQILSGVIWYTNYR